MRKQTMHWPPAVFRASRVPTSPIPRILKKEMLVLSCTPLGLDNVGSFSSQRNEIVLSEQDF